MKQGKIIANQGNKLIVQSFSSSVSGLQGKKAHVKGRKIGWVSEIIGRVDKPYLVIELFKNKKESSPGFVGWEISI